MTWFDKIFGDNKDDDQITCPRCLGKGFVDNGDIKRLKMELQWIPGECAYCNQSGTVNPDQANDIPVNEGYLTVDLDDQERDLLLNNDAAARERASIYKQNLKHFWKQIFSLYQDRRLNVDQITDLLLSQKSRHKPGDPHFDQERADLYDYIKKVIEDNFPKN